MPDGASIERWLTPNTAIAIAVVTEGLRSGEFLFTADTVRRTSEFYHLVLATQRRALHYPRLTQPV